MTLKEIAAELNVSSQTVSMVLSGKSRGRVAAATRERIEEYVHRTGFRRNMNASRIRRSCCEVITMVQDISNHGSEVEYHEFRPASIGHNIQCGVIDGALAHGYDVKYFPAYSESPDFMKYFITHCMPPNSDGVIFCGMLHNSRIYDAVLAASVPVMTIRTHTHVLHREVNGLISVDSSDAVRAGVRELLARGHKRIAYCAHTSVETRYLPERFEPFKAELTAAGLFDPALVWECRDMIAVRRKVEERTGLARCSAIVCENDMMANCWKRELEYAGFRVPEDFELMGYDANRYFSGFSTVDIHPYECGKAAAIELISAIKERRQPQSKKIKASYVPSDFFNPTKGSVL